MKRQNVRTLALIVVTFTYLLVGAAIFDALESFHEEDQKNKLEFNQDQLVKKYNISQEDLEEVVTLVLRLKPLKAGTQWKFAGSFYFATTCITTIGYGHSTPKTNGGKIFCMIYALPGIPLTIVMFQSIGERMNICITIFLRFLKRKLLKSTIKISQTTLILVSSNFVSLVIIFGALIFTYYENWTFFDSVYYCFITLTTIGFGDLVALQKNDFIAKRPDYVAFSLIFILFGLTVVSSVMNLLVLRFLTMNTEDECRDEFVAAVHAIDKNRDYSNKQIYPLNDILSVSKVQNNSYINPPMSDTTTTSSNCSCLCLPTHNSRLWVANFTCVDNKQRCILTRSCLRKNRNLNINGIKAGLINPVQWTVSSYHNTFGSAKKHYTVTRAPAVVRHLAESGFMRHYQCSPPAIKIDQAPSNRFTYNNGQNRSELDSSSSNMCDIDIVSTLDSNFFNSISECRRRRHNTL